MTPPHLSRLCRGSSGLDQLPAEVDARDAATAIELAQA